MTVQVSLDHVGARVYVVGNTFAIKAQLKEAGCHWDTDRKQWWIGIAKRDSIASIVGESDGKEIKTSKEELADRPCSGKVEYKGRTYYVIGQSDKTGKLWLTVLDCSIDFWALTSDCKWVKRYQSRQEWDGRRYSGKTVEVHQTVGKIRRFIESEKTAVKSGAERCCECGKTGDLVRDLEDGMMKHRHCCDMEPS